MPIYQYDAFNQISNSSFVSDGGSAAPSSPVVVYRNETQPLIGNGSLTVIDIIGTAGISIPGQMLNIGRTFRITWHGNFINNTGVTNGVTWNLSFGASGNVSSALMSNTTSANSQEYLYTVYLSQTDPTHICVSGFSSPNLTGLGLMPVPGGANNPAVGFISVPKTLRITGTPSSNSANLSILVQNLTIELL